MKIIVAGIGPGNEQYLLPIVKSALKQAEVIIGYDYYFSFIQEEVQASANCIAMPLGQEEDRANRAIEEAAKGKLVMVIGSGDASIYSMAAIVYELLAQKNVKDIEIETLPGISAFLAAGSKLGAPLGHDFCCISLSDLMTPWQVIEKRITAAAMGDFVTSLYNPKSKKRYWQLAHLRKVFLEHRAATTPVAIVRQVTRPEETIHLTTLGNLDTEKVDMFCLVMIGNSQTFQFQDKLVTPRGYLNRKPSTGAEIQEASFRTVSKSLEHLDVPIDLKWAMTRVVHTTGVLEDYQVVESTKNAISQWNAYLKAGGTIVTDVTMVQSGITKAFLKQYGNAVVCLLNEEETLVLAKDTGLTRSQAGIRRAIEQYPDALFVIGNAPTALFELNEQVRENPEFQPAGIIGVPVGFVNVVESKIQLSLNSSCPWLLISGNKGGSNVAAACVNAAFTLSQAEDFYPKPVGHETHGIA